MRSIHDIDLRNTVLTDADLRATDWRMAVHLYDETRRTLDERRRHPEQDEINMLGIVLDRAARQLNEAIVQFGVNRAISENTQFGDVMTFSLGRRRHVQMRIRVDLADQSLYTDLLDPVP